MTKKIISTDKAPSAIGVYSQAVETASKLVFISGQIPLDPESMEVVSQDFEAQAHQVLKNLSAVCEAAGGSLNDIVKLSIFVTNLSEFPKLNQICEGYFDKPYPARAVVEVSALPKGAQIEAEAVMQVS